MSEMAPERTAPPREPQRKGLKGALTRKIGPLPTWVWIIIVAAIILAYVVWKNSKAKKSGKGRGFRPGGAAPRFVNQRHRNPHPPGPPDEQLGSSGPMGSAAMAAPASDKDISANSNAVWHPKPPTLRSPPDDDDDRQPAGPMPPQPVW